jgi:hypothetical protein
MQAQSSMIDPNFPYVVIEISGGADRDFGYDGNGAFTEACDDRDITSQSEYLISYLRRLKEDQVIRDFGYRTNHLVGYQVRVIAKAEFAEQIEKLEFVMKLRWPSFRITKRTVIHVSETTFLTTDLVRVNSLC